jgi:hypothetical protein
MTDGAVTAKGQTDRTPLPCDNCSHAAVCALRPGLVEAVARIDSPKPRLPERLASAITISTLVRVTCEHHAPVRPPLTVERLAETGHAPVLPANPAAELVDPVVEERAEYAPDIPHEIAAPAVNDETETAAPVADVELTERQQQILDAIRAANGNQKAAAEALGLTLGGISGMLTALRAKGAVPADVVALIEARRALTSGMTVCEPGCGEEVHARGLGAHRVHCAAFQAYRAAHVREVEPLAGAIAPVPTPDVIASRDADERSHHERARAKAAETWARTHAEQAS